MSSYPGDADDAAGHGVATKSAGAGLESGSDLGPATPLPVFFLHDLRVAGFRAICDSTFTFQPGLNVLIGANNAAKTGVIDALRLLLSLGSFENREDSIRLRPTDVCVDGKDPGPRQISLTATFYGRTGSDVTSRFYEMYCPGESAALEGKARAKYSVFRLDYKVDFRWNAGKAKYEVDRGTLRGGPGLGNPVSYQVMDSMRAVYLAPLRDLTNDRARVGAEIEKLLVSHTIAGRESDRTDIPVKMRDEFIKLVKEVTADAHHEAASSSLAAYAKPYRMPDRSLSFTPSGISDDLFRAMTPVFAHGLHGVEGLPLSSNGLGVNQLIYASIVLSRRGEAGAEGQAYRFFLIEEPEAHLHPQLQDSFFHALNRITDHQIFVTSHSPTLTAKTDVDKIIIMRREGHEGSVLPLHLAYQFRDHPNDKRYLHKFLDVTRSQLLFARGAVFVEGVTEAMLLQRFSELIGYSLRDHGIEIVAIGSSNGFGHFRPLFDAVVNPDYRAVFITDGDEKPAEVKTDDDFKGDVDFVLDQGLVPEGATATAIGYGTLEFGLLRAAIAGTGHPRMLAILQDALCAAAPEAVVNAGKTEHFVRDFLDHERPALAYQKMKANTRGGPLNDDAWYAGWHTNAYFKAAKSDFAYHLHAALQSLTDTEARKAFSVPKYIKDAIRWVVGADVTRKESDAAQ
ncbi:ATP-dependent nuclease [Micromonospora sp. CA-263727]|uniref:ATP-dependent nuclease n=1 Tax=Micromonospora sp. CA-263727 TaxID=3239967 RepID=UPI003D9120C7